MPLIKILRFTLTSIVRTPPPRLHRPPAAPNAAHMHTISLLFVWMSLLETSGRLKHICTALKCRLQQVWNFTFPSVIIKLMFAEQPANIWEGGFLASSLQREPQKQIKHQKVRAQVGKKLCSTCDWFIESHQWVRLNISPVNLSEKNKQNWPANFRRSNTCWGAGGEPTTAAGRC